MDDAKTPPRQDRVVARTLRDLLASDLPGYPTDDRVNQSRHDRGAVYISITSIYNWFSAATVQVTEPAREGRMKKSRGAPGQQRRDQDYCPVALDHPLAMLFEHINPVDTVPQFWAQWILQAKLTGNVILWTPFNRSGRPCELWVLPTALCYPINDLQKYPEGAWRVNLNYAGGYMPVMSRLPAMSAILSGREILHFREPSPLSRWDGLSPQTALSREIDQYDALMESRISAFNNGFTPEGMIHLDGAQPEEVERFAAEFKNRSTGSKHHRKVHITNAPKSSFTPMNTSPREMDFQASWEQAVNVVLAGFGVHPAVAGIVKAGSYAESYSARQHMLDTSIKPLAANISAFLTKHLARKWYHPLLRVEVDPGSVNDTELLEKQLAQDGQMGVRTVNEIRAARNLDPLEGGDVPPEVYVQWVGQQILQPEQPEPGADPTQQAPGGHPLDAVGDAVLASLGVAGQVQKAIPYDEQKHKRDHGKFASKDGGGGQVTGQANRTGGQAAKQGQNQTGQVTGQVPAEVANHPKVKQVLASLAGAASGIATKVTAGMAAAGLTPEDVIGNWDDWSRIFVTHHADVVAHSLGVDALTAGHVLSHLAAHAWGKVKGMLGKGQPQQPQPVTTTPDRADGTDGGPPRPENAGGEGSLPPRPAMTKAFRDRSRVQLAGALDDLVNSLGE